jgi:hypothetical protein
MQQVVVVLTLAILAVAVQGFLSPAHAPTRMMNRVTSRMMAEADMPSDVNVVPPLDKSSPKSALITGSSTSLSRGEINEFVVQLEKTMAVKTPASSSLMNGVWELAFSGITSPGLLGYQIVKAIPGGDFFEASTLAITISSVQPRVSGTTTIKVFGQEVEFSVFSELEVVSDFRIMEIVKSVRVAGVDIPLAAIPESL